MARRRRSRGGQGSCSRKLDLNEDGVDESMHPQSQVVDDVVGVTNGKAIVQFVSTQVRQKIQVINPHIEVVVKEDVLTQGDKGNEKASQCDAGTQQDFRLVEEDVVTQGDEGKQQESRVVEEDVVEPSYHVDMDVITYFDKNSECGSEECSGFLFDEGWGEGEQDESTGEAWDFVRENNSEHVDDVDDELRAVDIDGGVCSWFQDDERIMMRMELNRSRNLSEGVVYTKAFKVDQNMLQHLNVLF
ncbi:hypothetical protein LXL04_020901 [Taraxacum kok-saghyz]